jgi:hypothetical protein
VGDSRVALRPEPCLLAHADDLLGPLRGGLVHGSNHSSSDGSNHSSSASAAVGTSAAVARGWSAGIITWTASSRTSYFALPGAVLATSGLLLLVFVINQVADRNVVLPVLVGAAVLAAGLLAGFVANERRSADPLVPLSIFRLGTLRYADLASLTVLAAPFGYSFVTTLYTQGVRGYSPLQTGLALLPRAVLSALVSRYAAPPLIQRGALRFTGVHSATMRRCPPSSG